MRRLVDAVPRARDDRGRELGAGQQALADVGDEECEAEPFEQRGADFEAQAGAGDRIGRRATPNASAPSAAPAAAPTVVDSASTATMISSDGRMPASTAWSSMRVASISARAR